MSIIKNYQQLLLFISLIILLLIYFDFVKRKLKLSEQLRKQNFSKLEN